MVNKTNRELEHSDNEGVRNVYEMIAKHKIIPNDVTIKQLDSFCFTKNTQICYDIDEAIRITSRIDDRVIRLLIRKNGECCKISWIGVC